MTTQKKILLAVGGGCAGLMVLGFAGCAMLYWLGVQAQKAGFSSPSNTSRNRVMLGDIPWDELNTDRGAYQMQRGALAYKTAELSNQGPYCTLNARQIVFVLEKWEERNEETGKVWHWVKVETVLETRAAPEVRVWIQEPKLEDWRKK